MPFFKAGQFGADRRLAELCKAVIDELKILLVPKDPNDERNVMLEIRAGTGGDEAALFAGDLFRMYGEYMKDKFGQPFIYIEHERAVIDTDSRNPASLLATVRAIDATLVVLTRKDTPKPTAGHRNRLAGQQDCAV